MHTDERNKSLSEELGKDVFHYHLHVVYIPVVEKQILWSKRCKDKSLIGTVKEVITQVSHSKKWSSEKYKDELGKTHLVSSYSKLQDRFMLDSSKVVVDKMDFEDIKALAKKQIAYERKERKLGEDNKKLSVQLQELQKANQSQKAELEWI